LSYDYTREHQLAAATQCATLIATRHIEHLDSIFGVLTEGHEELAAVTVDTRALLAQAWAVYLSTLIRHAVPILGADATVALARQALDAPPGETKL
jgi:hypothetical protein